MEVLSSGMEKRPADTAMTAWARLLRAHDTTVAAVEAELKQAGFPPIAWYDVLLELSREGGRELRPKELERELLIAQYNLSRLLDRLAAKGLIHRKQYAGDARSQLIGLTPKGAALQKKMWPHYRQAVERRLGMLTAAELEQLSELLQKLRATIFS
jgi:DNA-binding MarR family transcriptional regulator